MRAVLSNPSRIQSQGEEIANSISHGAGLAGAIFGTPYLVIHAVRHADAGFIAGTCIFSTSMILLYLASALYHAWPIGKAKRCFRIIEHSAIFILIAGTYTPLTLGILRGALGWTLFGVIWGLAIAGGSAEGILSNRPSHSFHLPLFTDGVASCARGEAFICQHALNGLVLINCGRLVLHRRCRLFRNRFAGTLWPLYLAPFCHHRHFMPLFLSPLVCGLTITKFPT